MFTGIIESVGKIVALEKSSAGGRLEVSAGGLFGGAPALSEHGGATAGTGVSGASGAGAREGRGVDAGVGAGELIKGESIAVNGCCLTVVEWREGRFFADLSPETLERTSFHEKKPGDVVNLERPLASNSRLGGHFVQGHVDATGEVTELRRDGESWWLSVQIPEDLRGYVAEKGSMAIDGISLTVARWDLKQGVASLAIIPFTYDNTAVHALRAGAAVNIECDILAKYVESFMRARKDSASRLTVEELKEQGF